MKISDLVKKYELEKIIWVRSNSNQIYNAKLGDVSAFLRMNNFPDEPSYTLFALGDALDCEDLSDGWELSESGKSSDENNKKLVSILSELRNQSVKWVATSSPLVFKCESKSATIFWKFNIWSTNEFSIIGVGVQIHMSEYPDAWSIDGMSVEQVRSVNS